MSKRFTDTEKWDDPWYMDLSNEHKHVYNYILDKCSNIGVWKPNKRLIEFILNTKINWDDFMQVMGSTRLKVLDNGNWFLLKFIDFQYGPLDENSTSKPIQSYIRELKKKGLWKHYTKGINTLKEKEKDKEQDKEKDKEKEYDFFKKTWNEMAARNNLSEVKSLSDKRKEKIRCRCKDDKDFGDNFLQAINTIPKSPFLLGTNDRGWTVCFDWIIENDTNYIKVCEGRYKNKKRDDMSVYENFINKGD